LNNLFTFRIKKKIDQLISGESFSNEMLDEINEELEDIISKSVEQSLPNVPHNELIKQKERIKETSPSKSRQKVLIEAD
jgi:hypothetical protein